MRAFAFIAMSHYLIASRMTFLSSNKPVTSLTALISDTSTDTRSFATNIPNIVPRWINLSLTCRVLITAAAAHSQRVVVESTNGTATTPSSTATYIYIYRYIIIITIIIINLYYKTRNIRRHLQIKKEYIYISLSFIRDPI